MDKEGKKGGRSRESQATLEEKEVAATLAAMITIDMKRWMERRRHGLMTYTAVGNNMIEPAMTMIVYKVRDAERVKKV